MDIGVIFPQTEVGGDRGAVRASGRPPRTWATATSLRTTTSWVATSRCTATRRPVHHRQHLPRTADDVRVSRRVHQPGLRHLHPHRAATPDRAAGQAGGRGRPALRGAASGSGWASAGTSSSTTRSACRSRSGPPFWRSRSTCCVALWTERSVTVDGRFHHIRASGLAPLPVQRPIPIWIGGHAPAALRRVGRIADGWFPHGPARRRPRRGARAHRRGGRTRSGGTCRTSRSRAGSTTHVRDHDRSPSTPGAGRRPGQATCRSTPCTPTCTDTTRTSPRWPKWPKSCCRRGRSGSTPRL
jgi:hypothetical protein